MPVAVVDAGPLYAAVDTADADHARCLEVLQRADLDLVVPALVVAEVAYLLGVRFGPRVEASFLRGLSAFEVEAPSAEDWHVIADLVERYEDFPLGGADASVVVLAQRLQTNTIVTLDHRHFRAIRTTMGEPFSLLP